MTYIYMGQYLSAEYTSRIRRVVCSLELGETIVGSTGVGRKGLESDVGVDDGEMVDRVRVTVAKLCFN